VKITLKTSEVMAESKPSDPQILTLAGIHQYRHQIKSISNLSPVTPLFSAQN